MLIVPHGCFPEYKRAQIYNFSMCSFFLNSILGDFLEYKKIIRTNSNMLYQQRLCPDLLDVDPNLFFLPPTRGGLREHPYKVPQGKIHHRRGGSLNICRYGPRKFGSRVDISPQKKQLLAEHKLSPIPYPSPSPINIYYFYMQPTSQILSMWFNQAPCSLVFTIINHNQALSVGNMTRACYQPCSQSL